MEPVELNVFIHVTVYRWLTVNTAAVVGAVFVSMADGALSLFFSVALFLGPGSAANTNHTERVVLSDLAVACCEAAVRAETHSLGGLALQMFMI